MWYDKYPGVPERGTPLETLFILVNLQRREAELLSTRALVLGSLANMVRDQQAAKQAVEGYQNYCDAMFPFFEKAAALGKDKDRERLLQHVKHPMQINMQMIREERAAQARAKGVEKFKIRRVEIPGAPRRTP